MAAGRTLRSLVSRRRRVDDEGEDEEGPVLVDDSQSEGSVLTEVDDDEDAAADASSLGGPADAQAGASNPAPTASEATPNGTGSKKNRKPKKRSSKASGAAKTTDANPGPEFKPMADTDAMMNGLKVNGQSRAEEAVVDFETMQEVAPVLPVQSHGDAVPAAERQRREHDEYRKNRDSNPAFIPNRGNFFMHDTRAQNGGPGAQARGGWSGRGRGRGAATVGGPSAPVHQMSWADRASEQTWKHDLHDTINEEPSAPAFPTKAASSRSVPQMPQQPAMQHDSSHLFPKPVPPPNARPPRSFDSTTLLGTVQLRVALPGMKAPISFADVPVRRYVRLPNHRPPLRRDKPVRVFIPGCGPMQRFPAVDRSFIFIPRQMRPNQQGFHRGYQRSIGGYGPASRRTSMHGSMYSGSVAPSRRSSLAGVSRDRAFSPASFVGMPPSRPVVRLPHGSQHISAGSTPVGPMSGYHTPTGTHQQYTYPLPQMPLQLGTPTTTVHQPRPTKTVDITGIEAQPFHSQLPAHMNEQPQYQPPPPPQPYFSPAQQYPYQPQHPQSGTPLSGIPEQAIHAPAFQPPGYGQPQFYPPYAPQQGYMFSPPTSGSYPPMPMYMMPPPQGYMLPGPGGPMEPPQMGQPPGPPPAPEQQHNSEAPQSGMVAHESNGMVFYVPASEAQSSEQYQPAEGFIPSYALPGLPPTPAPDNQMQYYHPPVGAGGMQDVGNGGYYPPQQ